MGAETGVFREYLKRNKLRWTPGRQLILKEVFATHRHFEVDELLGRLRKRDRRISRATLYRTLKLLVDSRLLRRDTLEEEHGHYEHVYGHEHHDHLLCLKCGRITEFKNVSIEHSQEEVSRKHGFKVTGHRLQITGYCRRCKP